MTSVDLIIPAYNGAQLLAACLRSLARSTFTDYRLIVFDDGSDPPLEPHVLAIAPDTTVVRAERNIGLARGFNRAIATGHSRFVVLLNNDTEVEPAWLAELVACAERHPEAGSIASKLRLMSDRGRLHSAGDYYSVRGVPGNRGVWLDDLGQFDHEEAVFSACGGAALFRREALREVALRPGQVFDERLFMYCEDIDLAWRLQRAGRPCWYTPRAVVYHHLSATAGGALASYYVNRNLWLVVARGVPRDILRPYRRRVIAHHAGRITKHLRHLREPAARAALHGTAAGLLTLAREGCAVAPLAGHNRQRVMELLTHAPSSAGRERTPRAADNRWRPMTSIAHGNGGR